MLPDFLCIGAKRAGTTWLCFNLRKHPQTSLPPIKEIRYLNDPSGWPNIFKLLTNRTSSLQIRRILRQQLINPLAWRNHRELKVYLRFLFMPRNDHWYQSLFPRSPARIAGDVTPGYDLLKSGQVARVKALLPAAKIIYLVRHPVDRIWSDAAETLTKRSKRPLDKVPRVELMRFLESEVVQRRSNYLGNLERWGRFYDEAQIFIGFYDHLVSDPADFFRSVLRFLDLDDSARLLPKRVARKVNPREYQQIPDDIARYLATRHASQIEAMHLRFANRYTEQWLADAQRYLRPR